MTAAICEACDELLSKRFAKSRFKFPRKIQSIHIITTIGHEPCSCRLSPSPVSRERRQGKCRKETVSSLTMAARCRRVDRPLMRRTELGAQAMRYLVHSARRRSARAGPALVLSAGRTTTCGKQWIPAFFERLDQTGRAAVSETRAFRWAWLECCKKPSPKI